jgi:hypothetical protein
LGCDEIDAAKYHGIPFYLYTNSCLKEALRGDLVLARLATAYGEFLPVERRWSFSDQSWK